MNTQYKDMLYLLFCSVNGVTPNSDSIKDMDMENLYLISKHHTVCAAVCIAIERAGIQHAKFHDALKKALRKNILFDVECKKIFTEFEKNKIWYAPIKGIVLKDFYPENGMREMADCDVLYNADMQQEVKQIMIDNGYTAKSVGKSNHDVYYKQPVLNYELHTSLFGQRHTKNLYNYYNDFKKLLKKDADNIYGYHLSDEDFYIYMTAHEWKHYSKNGTGIRSLLDCYVYLLSKHDSLDWKYIEEQLQRLEIAEYEKKRRELAIKVFSSDTLPKLDVSEKDMLMSYLTVGTYGTFVNGIKNELKEHSKFEYIYHKLFPGMQHIRSSVKFVDKCPILYPIGIVYRWIRIALKMRDKLSIIIKIMFQNPK